MRQLSVFLTAGVFAGTAAAQAYQPDFDPGKLKGPAKGPANEVMVLGSPYLPYFPKTFAAPPKGSSSRSSSISTRA